jgi:hypothetical protein
MDWTALQYVVVYGLSRKEQKEWTGVGDFESWPGVYLYLYLEWSG